MGPGVREHNIAQRAVAGGDAVVPDHASALQAAAREDIAATSDPEDVLCSICWIIIDLNDHSSVMRTQCNHAFHRTCLERWMRTKVRFKSTFCLPNKNL
jgi:hypothetical protein